MVEQGSLKVYPEVLEEISRRSPQDAALAAGYLSILGKVGQLFELQEKYGFYPENLTEAEFYRAAARNPELLSPYKLVRRKPFIFGKNGLDATGYRRFPNSRVLMDQIAAKMEEVVRYGDEQKLSERYLIRESLQPQIEAFREETYERARATHINTRVLPPIELVTGLFDRYLDLRRSLKFSWNGWLQNRDDELTRYYNSLIQSALPFDQTEKHRVVAGKAVAFAGLAARRGGWSGNTLPSEDSLRRGIGSTSYVFTNVIEEKFACSLQPALEQYVPSVTNLPEWEHLAKKAAAIDLVLHEGVGHPLVPLDETAAGDLRGAYTVIKELTAEVIAQVKALMLPARLAPPDLKQMIIAVSLAWWRTDVDSYLSEVDPLRKKVVRTYAQAAELMLNYYERGGFLTVNQENGQISLKEMANFKKGAHRLLDGLTVAISREQLNRGMVQEFINLNSQNPRRYLTLHSDNCLCIKAS